ncbi:MAG: hypothetical protein AAGI45_08165 [Cyanobacteria bacterium P01_H01_bin.26]
METTLPSDVVQGAIDQAAYYLVTNIQSNGMFRYRINTNTAIKVKPRYDIVHHAGCIHALSRYYQRRPNDIIYKVIESAGNYLCKEAIRPIPGESDILAVWSRPDIDNTTKPLQAKLGGTGLGLVALLSIEPFCYGLITLEQLRALGRFITYMQREAGDFYPKYVPAASGRTDKWQSSCYPGEAALGLMMLYERDPSISWLTSAYSALAYFAHSQEHIDSISTDYWALLAIEKILSQNQPEHSFISKELLLTYAIKICEAILQKQIYAPRRPRYHGGFVQNGRTMPTAAWVEGLLTALSFLPTEYEITKRIQTAVMGGVKFLLKAQINKGDFTGAIPRATGKIRLGHPAVAAEFNRRVTEVRIDYVQHAMGAWMQYLAVA